MRPRLFVVQPIPEVAIDILRAAADVEVYPYMDRQITIDELCKLDNVILAPHNGGATWDVRGEMNSRVARAIVAHIRGE